MYICCKYCKLQYSTWCLFTGGGPPARLRQQEHSHRAVWPLDWPPDGPGTPTPAGNPLQEVQGEGPAECVSVLTFWVTRQYNIHVYSVDHCLLRTTEHNAECKRTSARYGVIQCHVLQKNGWLSRFGWLTGVIDIFEGKSSLLDKHFEI